MENIDFTYEKVWTFGAKLFVIPAYIQKNFPQKHIPTMLEVGIFETIYNVPMSPSIKFSLFWKN